MRAAITLAITILLLAAQAVAQQGPPADPVLVAAAPAGPLPADQAPNQQPPEPASPAAKAADEKGGKEGKEDKDEKDEKKDDKKEAEPIEQWGPTSFKDKCGAEWYNCFGQATVISQSNTPFRSPYSGTNSFQSVNDTSTSETATLEIGARLGPLGEVYFDPEISGGRGLSGVYGLGGPPDGDIERVGEVAPTPYVARLYVQHDFALGDDTEKVEGAANQLGGTRAAERLTAYVGKFAAEDFFDNNRYSHDPRTGFMNWSLMYNTAWDYPADVRGYTWGGVVEWSQPDFAVRWGIFAEPSMANGSELDPNFGQAHGQALELERGYKFRDRPGKIRLMAYLNQADMGNYSQALALSPVDPDVTATRSYNNPKYGFLLGLEQEFTDDLGGFMRLGWNDGQSETWAFTEVDQTAAVGVVLKGTAWRRKQDEVGLGFAMNGISADHMAYLGAGGLGFELGDGRLSYGPECIFEAYYRAEFSKSLAVSPDFQFIQNPGYNTDRGPILIVGARVHAEF